MAASSEPFAELEEIEKASHEQYDENGLVAFQTIHKEIHEAESFLMDFNTNREIPNRSVCGRTKKVVEEKGNVEEIKARIE